MTTENPQQVSGDELDDILRGIAAEGGYASPPTEPTISTSNNDASASLGIDEEIVVTKKRIPIPKLDDVRLRSEGGIPRLRKISKERLRFKGKGHEYGDIARMLNMYQLWLDDLYPRAKFADALSIIEKVGHTKRMQVDRKAWIDEGKPKHTPAEDENDVIEADALDEAPVQLGGVSLEGQEEGVKDATSPSRSGVLQANDNHLQSATEGPDDDELDALLADSAQFNTSTPIARHSRSSKSLQDDPFADEMEAMEDLEDMW